MPANPKYLNSSPWQKMAKITSGIFGGYAITALFHIVLVLWCPAPKYVLITTTYTIFILWGVLLVIPFLFKNGWKAWALYVIILFILSGLYYLASPNNPFV